MDFHAYFVFFSTKFIPLLYAIIGFGVLIIIHEVGHFIFCKMFSIYVPTFSIGIGPKILQKKIGETNFRIAAIPIGGYVEIAGMAEVGQGDQSHAADVGPMSFSSKPYWQRFLVLFGGILFNMMFAYITFTGLFFVGMPVREEVELVVSEGKGLSEGQSYLIAGDKVLGIDDKQFPLNPKELFPLLHDISKKFSESSPKEIKVLVKRGEERKTVKIPALENGTNLQRGLLAGVRLDLKTLKLSYKKYSFFKAIQQGIQQTNEWVLNVLSSLKMLITKRNIKDFGGPIMIVSQSFKMAQQGMQALFVFLAIISINLAIINLLPLGALDGGQLLFETIEAVIRRRIPEVIRFSINLTSWILLLSLILFLSYQDIISLLF